MRSGQRGRPMFELVALEDLGDLIGRCWPAGRVWRGTQGAGFKPAPRKGVGVAGDWRDGRKSGMQNGRTAINRERCAADRVTEGGAGEPRQPRRPCCSPLLRLRFGHDPSRWRNSSRSLRPGRPSRGAKSPSRCTHRRRPPAPGRARRSRKSPGRFYRCRTGRSTPAGSRPPS